MTQNEMILDYLTQNGSITQRDAEREFGICRLASRINELKDRGVKIRKVMEAAPNRFGVMTRYARYFLGGLDGAKIDTL